MEPPLGLTERHAGAVGHGTLFLGIRTSSPWRARICPCTNSYWSLEQGLARTEGRAHAARWPLACTTHRSLADESGGGHGHRCRTHRDAHAQPTRYPDDATLDAMYHATVAVRAVCHAPPHPRLLPCDDGQRLGGLLGAPTRRAEASRAAGHGGGGLRAVRAVQLCPPRSALRAQQLVLARARLCGCGLLTRRGTPRGAR